MSAQRKPTSQRSGRPGCSACGRALARTYRFCPQCGAPVAAAAAGHPQSPAPSTVSEQALSPQSPLAGAGPSLQVAGIETEALAEERRLVTVMFADLSGSTALAERLDPEDLRRILASFFNALSRQIQRYGGTVDKYIGDAIMAVFGAPVAHEDDPERAIRAALAMQSAMARLNDDLEREQGVRLALRVGVNTGEVVAGLLGGEIEGAYTVVGDTVNLAQRLEAAAPQGQAYVGTLTYRLSQRAFKMLAVPPLGLKGKSELVPAYRVISARDEPTAAEPIGLLGREQEMAALHDALVQAMEGKGSIVAVVGDAGVGKSRLLKEFDIGIAAGIERIVARCASFDQATPYALVADVLRRAFGMASGAGEEQARIAIGRGLAPPGEQPDPMVVDLLLEVLRYGARSSLDPESKRRVLASTIRHLVASRCESAPLVIFLEDLHWMDSASEALLGEVVADVPSLPCLLVAACRPDWDPPWPCARLELRPLGDAEARALIRSCLGGEVEAPLLDSILAKTAGNPFFTEEVTRSLKESGAVERADGLWRARGPVDLAVPATVQEVLRARLDRLSTGPRRTLQQAAVIGGTFWGPVIQRLAPSPALAADLEVLEARSFIELQASFPERIYSFRHPLVQEVTYGTLLQAHRRVAHGAVGEAIEELYGERADELLDELAFHYGRSDRDERALHWLVQAGDRASRLFANAEALELYGSALERASRAAGAVDAGDILERMGDVETLTGKYDDALSRFRSAQDGAQPLPERCARLQRKVGTALARKGAYAEALDALREGIRALGGERDLEVARIGVRMGEVQSRSGDYAAARETLSRAVEIAERLGAEEVVAEGLKYLGAALAYVGDLRAATRMCERCLPVYERLGDIVGTATVRINVGALYRRMGQWDDALAEYDAALALAERIGNPSVIANVHNNIGELHFWRGDFEKAIVSKRCALEIACAIGSESQAALALMGVGIARVFMGDGEKGREDLREAEARFLGIGRSRYLSELYRCLAYANLATGDIAAATHAAGRALEYAQGANAATDEALVRKVLGEVALARGDFPAARAHLQTSRDRLAQLGYVPELHAVEESLRKLRD